MVERVRFGTLGASEFGLRVGRPGQTALGDPHPVLYTNYDSQQVIETGFLPANQIPDVIGAQVYVPFITTYSFTPIVRFWVYRTGENNQFAPTRSGIGGWIWSNIPRNNNLAHSYALRVTPSGFTLFNGIRWATYTFNSSGQLTGANVDSRSAGYALEYHVTKTRSPL